MPLRKKIPDLTSLCLENVARHIVKHGERLEKYKGDADVRHIYKLFQFLYTDDLVRLLFQMYREYNSYDIEDLRKFMNYLFYLVQPKDIANWPCLEFFFNEYTTALLVPHDTDLFYPLPNDVISYVISQSKNLRCLNEKFCYFGGQRILQRIPEFKRLREVDLGRIPCPEILERMFETCLSITVLSADITDCRIDGNYASDSFLFSLCKYSRSCKNFFFCPENGMCSRSGKYLQSLDIRLSGKNGDGLACALQHLPVLKDFGKPPCYYMNGFVMHHPDVVKGIATLHRAGISNRRSPVILELTDIFFDNFSTIDDLRCVQISCPKLENVQLNAYTFCPKGFTLDLFQNIKKLHLCCLTNRFLTLREFQQFLLSQSKQITVLGFISPYASLQLTHINDILNVCCNLKELRFWNFLGNDDSFSNWNDISSMASVETLYLNITSGCSRQSFYELLCRARNVKILDISSPLAEQEFVDALEVHEFRNLEYLCIRGADTRNIPFRNILNSRNKLRKLEFRDRKSVDPLIAQLKKYIRKANYETDIQDELDYFKYEEKKDTKRNLRTFAFRSMLL